MPFNNYNYGNSGSRGNGNYNNRNGNYNGSRSGYQSGAATPPPTTVPMDLPADYVDKAEEIMSRLIVQQRSRLTTSKLRNILSLVSDIYNREVGRLSEKELSAEDQTAVQMLRVRIVYEANRDPRDQSVKEFINEAHLLEYIKGLKKDRKKFLAFSHYMEALVAYHRYYGGSEK